MAKSKQERLPGLQNPQIEELHNKAIELEAVRSERMRLTAQEKTLSDELIALGKQYGKQDSGYNCEGVEVEYVPGDMKVKVRVAKAEAEGETLPETTKATPETPAEIAQADLAKTEENIKQWARRKKTNGQVADSVQ
jgi:hypothetical protein